MRERIGKIVKLSLIPIQQIHLTATLPPHLLPSFVEGLRLTDKTKIIRKTTERPEIQYSILKFKPSNNVNLYSMTLAKVQELNKEFTPKSRGIIFSRSIDGCKIIKQHLDCAIYHSGMKPEELSENFESWRSGKKTWIVATSGFTNGIDYPDVDAVLFMDPPYGLMDLVQGSGRGSRAGQPSKTILITSWQDRDCNDEPSEIWKCTKQMVQWMDDNKHCRRHAISACMDGMVRTCREICSAQLCDVCSISVAPLVTSLPEVSLPVRYASPGASQYTPKRSPAKAANLELNGFESRANGNQKGESKKSMTAEDLSQKIDIFAKGYCVVCFTAKGELLRHEFLKNNFLCQGGQPYVPTYGWIDFKKQVRLPGKYMYCYHCWTPQNPFELECHKITDYSDKNGCNLHKVLCAFAWTVFHDPRMRDLAGRKYGWNKRMTEAEYAAWCGTVEKSIDDSRFINIIHLFLFIHHYHNRDL